MSGALRDLVAILLLVIGPILLIIVGVVMLVSRVELEPQAVDPVEEVVKRATAEQPTALPAKTQAMDHMLDGGDAFFQAEQARERGDAAQAERLLSAAITHFERAVTIDGNMAEAHRSLAVALDEAGKEDAAVDHYRVYVALAPEAPDAQMVRALIALREAVVDEPDPEPEVVEPAPAKAKVKAKTAPPTKAVPKRLGRKDVLAVVNGNRDRVRSCLVAARDRGDIGAGRYKLMLDWTIEPDGSVSKARMLRPKKHRKTAIGRCVVGAMEQWRFPASNGRTPISYPLPLRVD